MMTATEYRAAIAALGLSQQEAADFLDANPRTSRRWARGENPVPRPVATLLRLMIAKAITPAEASRLS